MVRRQRRLAVPANPLKGHVRRVGAFPIRVVYPRHCKPKMVSALSLSAGAVSHLGRRSLNCGLNLQDQSCIFSLAATINSDLSDLRFEMLDL